MSEVTGRRLRILGIRGVPAAHGGFETFAEQLSLFLVSRGWDVTVYCQEQGEGPLREDVWRGVKRIHVPVGPEGPAGAMLFDWKSIGHAVRSPGLCLTLGYNTAVFCARLRLRGIPNLINMDGIEWARAKWGPVGKAWFWLNDWAGCWIGNHLIADHPWIQAHLRTRVAASKITTIPYGAEELLSVPSDPVCALGLEPGRFLTVIARAEPENSILEIVEGFSAAPRGLTLAVLGKYDRSNAYHRAVQERAGEEVVFLGAIYDRPIVQALRFHSLAYVHGHRVGGTNPSLVEALGAGNPVIAHDNPYNRWVAGEAAVYFRHAGGFSDCVASLVSSAALRSDLAARARDRFLAAFQWPDVLGQYEKVLTAHGA
jgi:glycosyltransferase involved in cell wall biosynthesis